MPARILDRGDSGQDSPDIDFENMGHLNVGPGLVDLKDSREENIRKEQPYGSDHKPVQEQGNDSALQDQALNADQTDCGRGGHDVVDTDHVDPGQNQYESDQDIRQPGPELAHAALELDVFEG